MTLRTWIIEAATASFPDGPERWAAAAGATAYLEWIESLPTAEPTRDWQDYDPNRWNLH